MIRGMTGVDGVLLTTARLRLRRFTMADVPHLVELDSDPEVMRFLTGGRPTPLATVRDEQLPGFSASTTGIRGSAAGPREDTVDGAFLGWFALDPSDDGAGPELGYRLRRAAWGRGLATEGARALVGHAFDTPGVRRVWAQTMAVNVRSRAVLAKAGLRYVRTFHLDWADPIAGTEQGEVEYELLRVDHRSPSGPGRR